ncbi:UNVERIFIED_CONTAM: hypothetical protein PYX00_006486 [Menopon gallinae]|uniref:PDZ domain-containing protein n=1 Tax=Menopon gallinae TaxID=328185 RepID=A0AAW2HVC1_9NEOP
MADEDYGDLNLCQYGGSGRWLQSTNPSWIQRSSANPSPQHNHIPGRYRGNSYEAEDASYRAGVGPPGAAQSRSRSGLYYSPPGTSYTIVERPVATTAITQQHHAGSKPVRAFAGSSHSQPHSHSHTPRTAPNSAGKKRPMSPEDVLKMFGPSANKGSNYGRRSQSPASSPPSTTHHQYLYQNTHDDLIVRTVTMVRPPDSSHGFGICVKGGKDSDGVGVYISRVEEGSVAERVGLRPGDSILEVNGTPFTAISHEEALKMLKSCRKLSMTVRSPNLPPQPLPLALPTPLSSTGPWLVRQTYSWMDRQGRPVSPPLEYARAAPPVIVTPRWNYSSRGKEKGGTRKVDLNIEPGQSLGLMIRGGLEYNLGIFITGVDKDSVADRAGLMVSPSFVLIKALIVCQQELLHPRFFPDCGRRQPLPGKPTPCHRVKLTHSN